MKVFIDNELICEVTDFDLRVLRSKINMSNLNQILKDRVKWDIESFCLEAYEELKKRWLPLLFARYESIPTGKKELLNLILSQSDYKDAFTDEMEIRSQSELSFSSS